MGKAKDKKPRKTEKRALLFKIKKHEATLNSIGDVLENNPDSFIVVIDDKPSFNMRKFNTAVKERLKVYKTE